MALLFVHLSDIHFGQEKGGHIVVNNDVKEQLIIDAHQIVSNLSTKAANGIIISGDIAFAGKKQEYEQAGLWLDRLTAAVGCSRSSVQVVPGNHDIDRDAITRATQMVIDDIAKYGDQALDGFLEKENDRELLYFRFSEYRIFADAYDCPLDGEGTIKQHRVFDVDTGKKIKFHGVNTALICSKSKTEQGSLLLGQRQRVIPTTPGIEIVVIAHHPLSWLQDSDDAQRYIKNRVRVFISGHEHLPSCTHQIGDNNGDLLTISSGATAPPKVDSKYTYCYNLIEFEWDQNSHGLKIVIHPRIWNDELKAFEKDEIHFNPDKCTFILRCPNYDVDSKIEVSSETFASKTQFTDNHSLEPIKIEAEVNTMSRKLDEILLLRFFRELSSNERLSILVKMSVLPPKLHQPLTHSVATLALKKIFSDGRSSELEALINEIQSQNLEKNNDD